MKAKHNCVICGKEHSVCSKYSDCPNKRGWGKMCDTEQHFEILQAINRLEAKTITPKVFTAELTAMGLTYDNVEEFLPNISKYLRKYLKKDTIKQATPKEQKEEVPVE